MPKHRYIIKVEGDADFASRLQACVAAMRVDDETMRAAASSLTPLGADARRLRLDASRWREARDAHAAIAASLNLPEDKDLSLAALLERMVWDEPKAANPPYIIEIRGTRHIAPALAVFLDDLRAAVERARIEHQARYDVDVPVAVALID